MTLPIHVQREAERILNAEARRLLAIERDRQAFSTTALTDRYGFDHGDDESASALKAEVVPIAHRDRPSRVKAA